MYYNLYNTDMLQWVGLHGFTLGFTLASHLLHTSRLHTWASVKEEPSQFKSTIQQLILIKDKKKNN